MGLETTLWIVALLLVVAVFVATAIKLWPPKIDDPVCGPMTHDGLFGWEGRVVLPTAGREIRVVFYGSRATRISADGIPDAPRPPAPAGSDWTAVARFGVVALPQDTAWFRTPRAKLETALLTLTPLILFIGGPLLILLVLGDKRTSRWGR